MHAYLQLGRWRRAGALRVKTRWNGDGDNSNFLRVLREKDETSLIQEIW